MGRHDHDREARDVLQAVAPLLRSTLGVPELAPGLVGDLYLRLLYAFDRGDGPVGSGPEEAPDLPLTIYLVLASHPLGTGPRPDLLVSLRKTLARFAVSAGGASEIPPRGSERRGSR